MFYKSKFTKITAEYMKNLIPIILLIGFSRRVVLGGLPIFSALESSFFTMVMSFYLFYHMVNLAQKDSRLSRFLKSPLWRPLRASSRVAYLVHINIGSIYVGYFNLGETITSPVHFVFSFLIYVIITYFVSIILTIVFELPLNNLSKVFINKLFKSHQKTL